MTTASSDTENASISADAEIEAHLERGVVLAGRTFARSKTTTFEHDAYTLQQLRDSGLLAVSQRFDPLHDDFSDLTTAIIIDAFASGKLFTLIASVLVEKDVAWSPRAAAENAAFFAALSDEDDKTALRGIIPWALLNFFLNADASWRIFLKFFRSVGNAETENDESAARLDTESGTTSSVHSPAIDPRDTHEPRS